MSKKYSLLLVSLMALSSAFVTTSAVGQIKIGQSLDGRSDVSKDYTRGVTAHLQALNKSGGIAGQTVDLITLMDDGDAAKTITNTSQLVKNDSLVGLIGYHGSYNTESALPTIIDSKTALFQFPIK